MFELLTDAVSAAVIYVTDTVVTVATTPMLLAGAVASAVIAAIAGALDTRSA